MKLLQLFEFLDSLNIRSYDPETTRALYSECINDQYLDQSYHSTDTPLTIAVNQVTSLYDGVVPNITIPNGWPTDAPGVNAIIKTFWDAGKAWAVNGLQSYDHMVERTEEVDLRTWFNSPQYYLEFPEYQWQYPIKSLSDIPSGERYLYPIEVISSDYFELMNIVIPDRVLSDARAGISKILFFESFEAYGIKPPRKSLDVLLDIMHQHQLPKFSIGYIDNNVYTPKLYSDHGIAGFFYHYMEYLTLEKMTPEDYDMLYSSIRSLKSGTRTAPKRFISLNKRTTLHRILMFMMYQNIQDDLYWTFADTSPAQIIAELLSELDDIPEQVLSHSIFDLCPVSYDGRSDYSDLWLQNHIQCSGKICLVNETHYFMSDVLFVTEKTYKPIVFGQPFVVSGNAGTLALLHAQGYQTFHPYINETYDTITDPVERLKAVMTEVTRLASLSDAEINAMLDAVKPILIHNHNHHLARRNRRHDMLRKPLAEIRDWVNGDY